jgi:hypothetical protein
VTAKPPDIRYVTVKVTAVEEARLRQIATEDGTSVTRLVEMWVRGTVRDYPRKEG